MAKDATQPPKNPVAKMHANTAERKRYQGGGFNAPARLRATLLWRMCTAFAAWPRLSQTRYIPTRDWGPKAICIGKQQSRKLGETNFAAGHDTDVWKK